MKVCIKCNARFPDGSTWAKCPHDQATLATVPNEVEVVVTARIHVRVPGDRLYKVLQHANKVAKDALNYAMAEGGWPELDHFELDQEQGPDNLPGTDVDELETEFLTAEFIEMTKDPQDDV